VQSIYLIGLLHSDFTLQDTCKKEGKFHCHKRCARVDHGSWNLLPGKNLRLPYVCRSAKVTSVWLHMNVVRVTVNCPKASIFHGTTTMAMRVYLEAEEKNQNRTPERFNSIQTQEEPRGKWKDRRVGEQKREGRITKLLLVSTLTCCTCVSL
jgi:hypothetical protein